MKPILLLDESLQVVIDYDCADADLADNICVKVVESCPEEEKIFRHDESNLYLTPSQARELADALLRAVEKQEKGK